MIPGLTNGVSKQCTSRDQLAGQRYLQADCTEDKLYSWKSKIGLAKNCWPLLPTTICEPTSGSFSISTSMLRSWAPSWRVRIRGSMVLFDMAFVVDWQIFLVPDHPFRWQIACSYRRSTLVIPRRLCLIAWRLAPKNSHSECTDQSWFQPATAQTHLCKPNEPVWVAAKIRKKHSQCKRQPATIQTHLYRRASQLGWLMKSRRIQPMKTTTHWDATAPAVP